jgi:formate hydrogenlyase subunit 3/multisubunit Na+/H+ antiporter MnhD subunit
MIVFAISLPIISACIAFMSKKFAGMIASAASMATLIIAILIFSGRESGMSLLSLHSYVLSSGAFLAASFFTLLTCVYSLESMAGHKRMNEYFCYILITLGACAGVFFSNDYLTMLMFWGMLGITLYMLVGLGSPASDRAAIKTFVIVGGSDALMMVGIGLIMVLTRSLQIGLVPIALNNVFAYSAFLLLAAGAFAKAGAIPFHSWIPDAAEVAPTPVMALLPASIDKLLGIYLLFRISTNVFLILPGSAMSMFLLVIGSLTIIIAVMAALVQHDLKKLLSFHAVSQVGYMVLGIGTASPIGIAGALFHMLNHAIYKSCLFFTAGSVEKSTGTTSLDKLGGLATRMPITFAAAAIAALSISGIPPLNGFISKWMIYQGLVSLMDVNGLWIIWLTAAMFGSALTLASFIKVLHAVYLGTPSPASQNAKEVNWQMWLPTSLLAFLCVIFGVFAYQIPLPLFIFRSVLVVSFAGSFTPMLATGLLLLGLLIGLALYGLGSSSKTTSKPAYVGGELLSDESVKVSGTEFYTTISSMFPLKWLYSEARKGLFDIYNIVSSAAGYISSMASAFHDGFLGTYLTYILIGAILVLVMVAR